MVSRALPATCQPPLIRRKTHSHRLVDEGDALVDGRLELRLHLLEPRLLVVRHAANLANLGNALRSEHHLRGEVRDSGHHRALNVAALDNVLLSSQSLEARVSHHCARVRHGERRGSLAILRLDNLRSAVLRANGERVDVLVAERRGGRRLREERQDGDSRVSSNDGHVHLLHLNTSLRGVERLGTHDIERGDAKKLLLVIHALLLQHLRGDGHGAVDGVADHVDERVGARLGARLDESRDDACVDFEEVVARHARLARHSGGDDDEVTSAERVVQLLVAHVPLGDGRRVDVADVRGNAWRARDIVERHLVDHGVHLHEHGERLSDASGCPEHSHLASASLGRRRGECARARDRGLEGGRELREGVAERHGRE
mmetsp:Transcript_3394/g.9161  ORF Transcript_3394/g.9161 Transcript_3394/m.9161 type:complete len:373 (+) Transcript_3394:45-1163(+)